MSWLLIYHRPSLPIELKSVDEQIMAGRDIVLIPMELMVCSNCGERYYDRNAMKKIEEIREKLRNQEIDVEEVGKVMRMRAA